MRKIWAVVCGCVLLSLLAIAGYAQDGEHDILEQEVVYPCDGKNMYSFIAYDGDHKGKLPVAVVVPEWWGIDDYAKTRARMLAQLGYLAIAVDMYGEGKIAMDPKQAKEYATPFYTDPQLGKRRIEAAISRVKELPQADGERVIAVGYCFGGSMVLNAAKMGSDLKAAVSFHGGLATVPAKKGAVKGQILVCHGAADKFVSAADVKEFRGNLDAVGVPYEFIIYPEATHAFTNPESTETGKKFDLPIAYNEAADKKSWEDMKVFLKKVK
jgi:dienelactone hydrolase